MPIKNSFAGLIDESLSFFINFLSFTAYSKLDEELMPIDSGKRCPIVSIPPAGWQSSFA